MRIRQVRPEFWSDETMAVLPDSARLFYIGLWNIADDAGWIEWRPSRIGALLYPYRPSRRREADIVVWSHKLVESGRLVLHDCGCAQIPTLPRHTRVVGKQTFAVADRHFGKHTLLTGKQSPLSGSPVEKSREEKSREEKSRAGARDSFKERMAANGAAVP